MYYIFFVDIILHIYLNMFGKLLVSLFVFLIIANWYILYVSMDVRIMFAALVMSIFSMAGFISGLYYYSYLEGDGVLILENNQPRYITQQAAPAQPAQNIQNIGPAPTQLPEYSKTGNSTQPNYIRVDEPIPPEYRNSANSANSVW